MPSNLKLTDAIANAAVAAEAALFDGGKIEFYDGTQPSVGGAAIGAQNLLGTVVLADPAFGSPSGGVCTLLGVPLSDTAADMDGDCTWARCYASDDTVLCDCNVATSGADLNVTNTTFVAGVAITITSLTLSQPKS